MHDLPSSIDADALRATLEADLGAEVAAIRPIDAGLNLVVGVDAVDGGQYVLRRPNKLRDVEYFLELEREFAVMEHLSETRVPAPEPVLFRNDPTGIDGPILLMTRLRGEPVPLGADLPDQFRTPAARKSVAHLLVDTLSTIHSVDPEPFEAVCDHRSPHEQTAAAIDRIDAATAVTGHETQVLREVGDWLRENAPETPVRESTLLHGDFRPGNVLLSGDREPELSGVLDWETAVLGDPLTELGYLLLRWRDAGDPTPSLNGIVARHGEDGAVDDLRGTNENGLCPFSADPGAPTRGALIERYENATGATFDRPRFYVAHAAHGLAAVWEDLDRERVEAGKQTTFSPHIEYIARFARNVIDGSFIV